MFRRIEIVRNGKHAQMPRMGDIQRQQRMIDAAQFRAADDDERQPPRRKIIEERRRAGQWNIEAARAFKQDEFVLFFQLPRRKGTQSRSMTRPSALAARCGDAGSANT